jgi:hypothetical protein
MGDKIDIDQLVRMLETLTENFKGTAEATEEVTNSLEKQVARNSGYAKQDDGTLKKIKTQAEKRIEIEEKLNKEIEAQFGKEKVLADKRDALYKDQLRSMGYSIDANNQLIKTSVQLGFVQRQQIQSLKRSEEASNSLQKAQDDLVSNLKNGAIDLGKGMGRFVGDLAKGNTGFSTLNPLIDIVANSMGALAKAIPFVGDAAAATIKATAEGSKFIIELMDKNLKAFQELSNSGALVADGMTGVGRQLVDSGMTLEGFKKSVKENAGALASWGGTVGEGASRFSDAVGKLTKRNGSLAEAGMGLRKLGLTADDIGEQAGAFLQQEIRLGRGRQMSEKQLAEGTVQYVKELDLLQKVTGLSRQDAQRQRDELLSDSRYRASIEGMNKENQNALNTLMLTFKDPAMKRGLMDLTSGAVTTKDAGVLITAFGDTAAESIQSLKDAKPEDIPKIYDKIMRDFQESAKNNKEMFGEVYKYLEPGTMLNFATVTEIANGKYVTSMTDAVKKQKAQIEGTDKLTAQAVKAQQAMEALSLKMFELGNKMLPLASSAVETFTDALLELAQFIEDRFNIKPERQNQLPATPEAAGKERESAEKNAEEARKKREAIVEKEGRASEEAKKARIEEAKARREAERARAREETVRRQEERKKGPTGRREEPPTTTPTTPTTPSDVMKLIKFQGDALGNKEHFDGLNADVRSKFMEMIAEYNKPVQVNAAYRSLDEQSKLWKEGTEVPGNPDIRMRKGLPVARPGTSKHESGKAIDLNSTDVDALDRSGLLSTYGFKRLNGDPPHIEMARFGAEFDGPQSGYPVMLHGPEIAIPKPEFEMLKQTMNSVTKNSLASAMPAPTARAGTNDAVTALKSLHGIMSDKFDQMINVMERSNDLQSRLLNNSMI